MKLDQGAEIRTGLRSAVQFVIGGDQTITLDRLGTVTVLQAFQSQGKEKTDLGLKYGRTRYDIKKTDLEHESTIRSPGSTLAIRGTDVIYEDQAPWVPTAVSREGRAEFRNYRRQFLAFGGTRRARVEADKNSTAETAVVATRVDPKGEFSGRTEAEKELLTSLQSVGGFDANATQALLQLSRDLPGAAFAGIPDVPGPLEFQLAWIPPGGAAQGPASNVDLFVTDPRGATASALNPVIGTGSSTGMHFGDDPGANGNGAESVAWGLFFPGGKYTVAAKNQAGADAQVFVNVFQGQSAEPIKQFGQDQPIVLKAGETFTGSVKTRSGSSGRELSVQRKTQQRRGR
jgi:hypothetical protein